MSFYNNLEENEESQVELSKLNKILKIIAGKENANLPPDFFTNLNFVFEIYAERNKLDFLIELVKEMDADELVSFIFNKGERRNRPRSFILNDTEIDVYGKFFRKMCDYIPEKNPEVKISKKEINDILKKYFYEHLKIFFDKDFLEKKFMKEFASKKTTSD